MNALILKKDPLSYHLQLIDNGQPRVIVVQVRRDARRKSAKIGLKHQAYYLAIPPHLTDKHICELLKTHAHKFLKFQPKQVKLERLNSDIWRVQIGQRVDIEVFARTHPKRKHIALRAHFGHAQFTLELPENINDQNIIDYFNQNTEKLFNFILNHNEKHHYHRVGKVIAFGESYFINLVEEKNALEYFKNEHPYYFFENKLPRIFFEMRICYVLGISDLQEAKRLIFNELLEKTKVLIQTYWDELLPKLDRVPPPWRFNFRLKRTHGRCFKSGQIEFSPILMQFPEPLIKTVVAHELAHLKHMNHSKAFYAEWERLDPVYPAAIEWESRHPYIHQSCF